MGRVLDWIRVEVEVALAPDVYEGYEVVWDCHLDLDLDLDRSGVQWVVRIGVPPKVDEGHEVVRDFPAKVELVLLWNWARLLSRVDVLGGRACLL